MAALQGLSSPVISVGGPMPSTGSGSPNSNPQPVADFPSINTLVDGTPMRIVVIAGSAALGLVALKMAGFRFNIAVSS